MTAVEWLINEVRNSIQGMSAVVKEDIFEQAKEMEKENTMAFGYRCIGEVDSELGDLVYKKVPEEVYNETYGSKGSDEPFKAQMNMFKNFVTSSQTEISDEMSKIEKALYHAWSDYEYKEGNLYSTTFRDGWLMAIEWYREQLKKK